MKKTNPDPDATAPDSTQCDSETPLKQNIPFKRKSFTFKILRFQIDRSEKPTLYQKREHFTLIQSKSLCTDERRHKIPYP